MKLKNNQVYECFSNYNFVWISLETKFWILTLI